VSDALASLPWVEPGSIKADGKKRQAKFTVADPAKFNMDEVKRALGDRYSGGVKLLAGPTPGAEKTATTDKPADK
jgi:hypothetical protein